MIYVWLFLLIAVLAWREVQILIDRKSYKKENLRFNPYWYIDQSSRWKNFDSFHVANGLTVLLLLEAIIELLPQFAGIDRFIGGFIRGQVHVIVYWLVWMQIRNLFMRGIYKR